MTGISGPVLALTGLLLMHPQLPATPVLANVSTAPATQSALATSSDPIVAHDQSVFTQFNLAGRFHLHFHPHKAVCSPSTKKGVASCTARVLTNANGVPLVSSGPQGYSPTQLLTAYDLPSTATGHPIIALVDAYDAPNIQSDLSTYSSQFGLPQLPACSGPIANSAVACFQKVNQLGATNFHLLPNLDWIQETSLDVEIAHGLCQNCSILLVEADSSAFNDLDVAEDRAATLGAKVISNSFGTSVEFTSETQYDVHYHHPGVAVVVASGDFGYGTGFPAGSPYVTAVGGTTLLLNGDNTYNSELAWSGSGSTCSLLEPKPSWQHDSGCSNRTVADVAADADPETGASVYISTPILGQSGWYILGGTSLATPIIAAVYALSGNIGTTPNATPYTNGTGSNLHDITSGSNGFCGSSYLCTAGTGYDGPTGLGSPNGTAAF